MKKTSLLLVLTLQCLSNNVYCSETPVLSNTSSTPLTQVSLDEQKESLIGTIDGLIPLLNAHLKFASKVIEHIGKFKTNTSDIEDAEIAEFIDLHLSKENIYSSKASLKERARVLYQQHANDEIAHQYFIKTLEDLKWALVEMDADVSHRRIQQTLFTLLKNIADFNDATCNDISNLILKSDDKELEYHTFTTQQLIQLATSTTPRQQRISLIDTVINYIDETSRPELYYQYQLAMFCMEMENKLLPFCIELPADFSDDYIKTGFTNEINELVAEKVNSYIKLALLNPPQHNKTSFMQKKLRQKIIERHEKEYTLADEFPSPKKIEDFLKTRLVLRKKLFLTEREEFLPEPQQNQIIAAAKKKIIARKRKEKTEKIKHSTVQPSSLIPEIQKTEVVSPANTSSTVQKDVFIESANVSKETEILTTPAQSTPVDDEQGEWDYWVWYNQQDFAKKQNVILNKQQDNIIKEHLSLTDTLTGKALVFYQAVFGLGSKNVTQSDFNAFLKQIRGQKMKQTPRGLKIVHLDDTSVLCTYAIPDLINPENICIFKVHQPHGNQSFPLKTLKLFLNPQLSSAGYNPRQSVSEEMVISEIDQLPKNTPKKGKQQKNKNRKGHKKGKK